MDIKHEKSVRIQNSVLNGLEKKVLVYLAGKQPGWVTSNFLTAIGTIGAVIIGVGYVLGGENINFLWISSLGFLINWYGDSLDGTLARVRNTQRPLFGYYIDHTLDAVNELIMFLGLGLSGLMHFELALLIFIVYLMLTLNVSINAHLKKEFCLTYAGMGPTEFRIIAVIINTILIYATPVREFAMNFHISGNDISFSALDLAGTLIFVVLVIIYICSILKDMHDYSLRDPMPGKNRQQSN